MPLVMNAPWDEYLQELMLRGIDAHRIYPRDHLFRSRLRGDKWAGFVQFWHCLVFYSALEMSYLTILLFISWLIIKRTKKQLKQKDVPHIIKLHVFYQLSLQVPAIRSTWAVNPFHLLPQISETVLIPCSDFSLTLSLSILTHMTSLICLY